MRTATKLYLLDEQGQRYFGDGPCTLLRLVEETGSLRRAAQEMGMAYTKALRLLRHAEQAIGAPLTERNIGGSGGGGSRLTNAGKELVEKYERCRALCIQANRQICDEIFGGDQ